MSAPTTAPEEPWYADLEDPDSGWGRVCARMRELSSTEVLDGEEAGWLAFARTAHEALDQELYGEYLLEGGPDPLGPMWFAFREGWAAGAGQYDKPNARLIAAAPDLYAICAELWDGAEGAPRGACWLWIGPEMVARLRDALAKAEGREPQP